MPTPAENAALLIIDMINALDFEGAEQLFPRALRAAERIAALKARAREAGLPVIYVNDNFGKWRSDFKALLERCLKPGVRGRPLAELLRPDAEDYFVLKPKHSGFHGTTLDVLLAHLQVRNLILTGIAADFCVMFTAQDAYMRDYRLVVPRDCVAAEKPKSEDYAVEHMANTLRADTRESTQLDLQALGSGRSG
jgi:nicotinamidase-related amidase